MQLKVKGIVINETPYGETSKILSVLTDTYGVISVIAKGCKNMKNKLRGISNKMNYCEYVINYKEKGISTLIEGVTLNSFKNVFGDMKKSIYSFYLLDMIKQVANENNDKNLFNILSGSLIKINDGLSPELISNIVELQLLSFLGVNLNLNSCVLCGNKNNLITIDMLKSGCICKDCYHDEPLFNEKALRLMQILEKVDLLKVEKLEITDYHVFEDIDNFLHEYYENYTGIYHQRKNKLNSYNYVN